jgi:hypothetical protein
VNVAPTIQFRCYTPGIGPRSGIRKGIAMFARALAFVIAFLLCVAAPLGTHPAEAKKRKKFTTVTRTFSQDEAIVLDATQGGNTANPFPSLIEVKGLKKGKLLDVDVVLRGLVHPEPDDLDVRIVAPGGRDAIIMSDAGGNNAIPAATLMFDDSAPEFLPDSGQIATGRFKTTNYEVGDAFFFIPVTAVSGNRLLSTFNGINPNGTWVLVAQQDSASPGGSIAAGWQLRIKAKVKK